MKDDYNKQEFWSKENCVCGYWDKDGKHNKEMKRHAEGCANHIVDNTPNAAGLMRALRTIGGNRRV